MNTVTFNGLDSFQEYGLILKEKNIAFAKPKTSYVDIPYTDGSIDLSTALTNGDVRFKTRQITMTFTVVDLTRDWETVKSNFANDVNGVQCDIIFSDDANYVYKGRVTLNSWKSNKRTGEIAVVVEADPYKYDLAYSNEQWLWNPFDFRTGIAYELGSIQINGTTNVNAPNRRHRVVPVIISDSAMTMTFNSKSYSIVSGSNRFVDVVLEEGDNEFIFTGNGVISIEYLGGTL